MRAMRIKKVTLKPALKKRMFNKIINITRSLFQQKEITDNKTTINEEIIKEYNKHRPFGPKPILCYAPFKSMYFDIDGRVGACGLSFKEYEKYPDKSISEIWNGEKFNKHRNLILKNDLSYEFDACKTHITNKNFYAAKAMWYDNLSVNDKYPTLMEFDIDNTCNLECIMCNASKSSSISNRKNINKAHKSPYNKEFVNQLEEFIPHLEKAIFIGGEPFLINIYYDIWERMIALNPNMLININTNSTVLNDRIKTILNKGKFEFNLSIDSLNRATYEKIRVNASFDETMENLYYFHNYCNNKGTQLYMCPCPMKENWEELPDFVKFCNEQNIMLFLYIVFQPYELALWSYSSEKLYEIYNILSEHNFKETNKYEIHNNTQYKSFIKQVKTWYNDALIREKHIISSEISNNNTSNKDKLINNIKEYLSRNQSLEETEKNEKLNVYITIIDNIYNNLPKDIDQSILFGKLCNFDVSFVIEQLEINNEKELIDQAKMLYYTSYLD